ncbi:MAG TPA: CHC2 zinc finger domain-containing protein [Aquella sp.]|nr:CHC2 zinc finger domain-containing protein [Aquella sp.]
MKYDFAVLCPFHEEKTPSFLINKDEGLYYCLSCEKKGKINDSEEILRIIENVSIEKIIESESI